MVMFSKKFPANSRIYYLDEEGKKQYGTVMTPKAIENLLRQQGLGAGTPQWVFAIWDETGKWGINHEAGVYPAINRKLPAWF